MNKLYLSKKIILSIGCFIGVVWVVSLRNDSTWNPNSNNIPTATVTLVSRLPSAVRTIEGLRTPYARAVRINPLSLQAKQRQTLSSQPLIHARALIYVQTEVRIKAQVLAKAFIHTQALVHAEKFIYAQNLAKVTAEAKIKALAQKKIRTKEAQAKALVQAYNKALAEAAGKELAFSIVSSQAVTQAHIAVSKQVQASIDQAFVYAIANIELKKRFG